MKSVVCFVHVAVEYKYNFEKQLKWMGEVGAARGWDLPGLFQTAVGRLKHTALKYGLIRRT